MSKTKKVLLNALSLVLVAALAVAGTVAYLTSTDSDVNVMTLGNVEIEQIEQQWNEDKNKLVDFEDDKPLYPYVGELGWETLTDEEGNAYGNDLRIFTMENVVDKYVSVENKGKSEAYVRTILAFEMGDMDKTEFEKYVGYSLNSVNGSEFQFDGAWSWDEGFVGVDENDNQYYILVATHIDPVQPGETTIPSLLQVYLSKEADNEQVQALDGNGDGKYNIIAVSQAVQTNGFADAVTALNEGFEIPNANSGETSPKGEEIPFALYWIRTAIANDGSSIWEGDTDTSWYSEEETVFEIEEANQLAGLAELVDEGNTFEGKTVKLKNDIDLANLLFEPIGSYRKDKAFKGVFDGQGHTISNLSQNTWELDNGYSYGDLGLGLFGLVENGEVKDLVMDGVSISGESAICGSVASCAYDSNFTNVTVKNAVVADYQYYAGGVVGWASGTCKFENCDVDATNTIAAQWGDFDNSTGGIIGGCGANAVINMKDCDVACRIDAYNDVTSTYQWYAYRRCGMLIGNTSKTKDVDSTTYADAPQLKAENCTVTYGDWANYTYCEFAGKSWPYVRVQAGVSNSAYSNPRYGHPTDANGNEVVDDNHVHNDGEDHFIECTFDQLYGGGQGVYGTAAHDGVTVIYNNK